MRAAVYRRFGGPAVVRIQEVPRPSVRPDDVLIRVHASTVSAADHRARSRDVPRGLWLLAAVGIGAFRPQRRVLDGGASSSASPPTGPSRATSSVEDHARRAAS